MKNLDGCYSCMDGRWNTEDRRPKLICLFVICLFDDLNITMFFESRKNKSTNIHQVLLSGRSTHGGKYTVNRFPELNFVSFRIHDMNKFSVVI